MISHFVLELRKILNRSFSYKYLLFCYFLSAIFIINGDIEQKHGGQNCMDLNAGSSG